MTAQAPQPKKRNTVKKNLFTAVRTNSKGIVVPVRQAYKREKFKILKPGASVASITMLSAFEPKSEAMQGHIKLLKGQAYGSKNLCVNNSGLLERVEVNIYDPQGLPFDFHLRDANGDILKDTAGKEIGLYAKLKELRRVMQDAKVIHRLNLHEVIAEDKLDNYLHAPHIDEKTGRETSIYTRYSSASADNRLGRVLSIELDPENVYKFQIESDSLFVNSILGDCELVFEALVREDTNG